MSAGRDPLEASVPAQLRFLEEAQARFLTLLAGWPRAGETDGRASPPLPRLDQDFFCPLDALCAYAMIRTRRPRRLVEIGGGHSSRILARARADAGLSDPHDVIDPVPARGVDRLAAAGAVRLHAVPVEEASRDLWRALAPGDCVFVDGAHRSGPGRDVDFVFGALLPALPAGVLVHVHDIFLPDAYPAAFAARGYDEQIRVAQALAHGRLRCTLATHVLSTRMAGHPVLAAVAALAPSRAPPASLWALTAPAHS